MISWAPDLCSRAHFCTRPPHSQPWKANGNINKGLESRHKSRTQVSQGAFLKTHILKWENSEAVLHITHACNAAFITSVRSNLSNNLFQALKTHKVKSCISLFTLIRKKHVNNLENKCRAGTAYSNTHNKLPLDKNTSPTAPCRKHRPSP